MNYYDEALKINYEIREKDGRKYTVITDADKKINEICIPETIGGYPVEGIGKKAFLGCKGLRRLHLPETVISIGEWAFAFCDNLIRVEIPRKKLELGKGVFKNDDMLREIFIYDIHSVCDESHDINMAAKLMAAAPVIMDAEYLLDTEHAGSDEWLRKWDTRLAHILSLKDDEGYHLYVLCGEEDLHFDYEEYLEYNREKKSSLCMLRLVNDLKLSEDDKKPLGDYLLEHTCGCESEAAVRVLLKRHGDDRDYYRMMLDTGAINNANLEAVLNMMGDRHAQMKAYLIEECGRDKAGYFDDLEL